SNAAGQAEGRQPLSLRVKGDAPRFLVWLHAQGEQLLPGQRVPDLDAVGAGTGQAFAVWAVVKVGHLFRVAGKGEHGLAGGQVPDVDFSPHPSPGLIKTAAG